MSQITLAEPVREKAIQISETILSSSFWQEFKAAEQAMLANEKIQQLIGELRKKQSAHDKLERQLLEHPKLAVLNEEIEQIMDKLEKYSEVLAFGALQDEIGECLQGITKIIGWTVEGIPFDWEVPADGSCCSMPSLAVNSDPNIEKIG